MRRIDRIAGRSDDMLIVRGVNVFPTQIEELVLRDPRLGPDYRIRLTREGRLDAMTVFGACGSSDTEGAACASLLRERIKTHVGLTVAVELAAPGTLEASQGKAQRVIDERRSGAPV